MPGRGLPGHGLPGCGLSKVCLRIDSNNGHLVGSIDGGLSDNRLPDGGLSNGSDSFLVDVCLTDKFIKCSCLRDGGFDKGLLVRSINCFLPDGGLTNGSDSCLVDGCLTDKFMKGTVFV